MGGTKFDFSGQTVVVTGGTRGIGKGIAQGFAGSGGRVYMLGRNQENGLAVESEFRKMGLMARFLPCDVTHSGEVFQTFENILEDSGRLDVLVNNAGGWKRRQSVEDTPEDEWDDVVNLNLKSVFLCAKAAIPAFKRQRSGHIINITSIGALTTAKTFSSPPYIASKAGVHGLTRVLAAELGEYGVTVNALAPATTIPDRLLSGRSTEELKQLGSKTVAGRLAEVADIVGWVQVLATPESSYLTGQSISVNGGRLMV